MDKIRCKQFIVHLHTFLHKCISKVARFCYSELAQSRFKVVPPVKITFRGINKKKRQILGKIPVVKFALQGINSMLLVS